MAVLLGVISGFNAATAPPSEAATCSSQQTFELHRLLVEFGGTADGSLDGTGYLDTDVDPWCYDGNDIIFSGHSPSLHISCSESLTGTIVSGPGVPGGSAAITEFWLDSRNPANDKPDRELCQAASTFPEPDPDPTCEDRGDCPDPDPDLTGEDRGDCPDPDLTCEDRGDCPDPDLTCEDRGDCPDPDLDCEDVAAEDPACDIIIVDPAAPAIALVKTAVVGDGENDSDLALDDEIGVPTLFFSTGSPGDQAAVYEYTITNTGPLTLFDVTLVDDRLGTILDVSQEVTLLSGESTTVRASETFSIEDASGGLDNFVTNTATTTAVDEQDTEVSDVDDAVIQLVAQQSSILIDLDKIVVVGAGDVIEDADGAPVITWQESEFDANEAKTVRYRFTISNVGPSTLYDIELTDDMLGEAPVVPATDGLTIEPGESTVIEVDHQVTPEDAFPADPTVLDGQIEGDLLNTASVRGSNEARDAFDEDTDTAAVLVRAPRSEVLAAGTLPATGLGSAGGLLVIALFLLWLASVAFWVTERRTWTIA